MTYDVVAGFARSWGAVMIAVMYGVAIVYALWPRNKAKFDRAARTPLNEDE